MRYTYQAVITPWKGTRFEVDFPDLQGCHTSGASFSDSIEMGADLLECAIGAYLDSGKRLPKPSDYLLCPHNGQVVAISVVSKKNGDANDLVTTREASDILGVSRARVCAMVKSGILQADKIGRDYRITVASIKERMNNPVSAGRPFRSKNFRQDPSPLELNPS